MSDRRAVHDATGTIVTGIGAVLGLLDGLDKVFARALDDARDRNDRDARRIATKARVALSEKRRRVEAARVAVLDAGAFVDTMLTEIDRAVEVSA